MATNKYLDKYAEPEAAQVTGFTGTFRHVLCIPAFAETPGFLAKLTANITTQNVLVILVNNAPETANQAQLTQTRALSAQLKQRLPGGKTIAPHISLHGPDSGLAVLLVNRIGPGQWIPASGGVGQARKIACDMACRLISEGIITSPWIHSTDADAILPADYFAAVQALDAATDSAGIYPFRHLPAADADLRLAQQLYDASLNYYVAGLQWAGSPYAFYTIGSTLVINAQHYARCRGFPKRQAGEDFYLLNKLAKTGAVQALATTPIALESRLSDRVPFGTGPGVEKILALDNPVREFLYYHPLCFVYLKCWLELVINLPGQGKVEVSTQTIARFIQGKSKFAVINSAVLANCLHALGVKKALQHAQDNSTSSGVFKQHIHNWFDGFRTLKFIHWLRDNHLPSQPLAIISDATDLPFGAGIGAGFAGHDQAQPAWSQPPRSPRQTTPGH